MSSQDSETAFMAACAALTAGATPSAGNDLLGMSMDFDVYLFESELLSDVLVASTGDPENLLDVTAIARPGVSDDQVEAELVRAWMDDLRYGFAEAHVVTREPVGVRMRAITKIAPHGFYVTATVTVSRSPSPR